MLIHAILPASRVNGPGLRMVVFVQGCDLHCEGCFNPLTHPFVGRDIPVANVLTRILMSLSDRRLGGVTFSGGEPMQQAEDVSMVLKGSVATVVTHAKLGNEAARS